MMLFHCHCRYNRKKIGDILLYILTSYRWYFAYIGPIVLRKTRVVSLFRHSCQKLKTLGKGQVKLKVEKYSHSSLWCRQWEVKRYAALLPLVPITPPSSPDTAPSRRHASPQDPNLPDGPLSSQQRNQQGKCETENHPCPLHDRARETASASTSAHARGRTPRRQGRLRAMPFRASCSPS